jgi:hypothetical protein
MTKENIQRLAVGDLVRRTMDTRFGLALPGARWSAWEPVTSITYRGTNTDGKDYVGFYTRFGVDATMSGSIAEGETYMEVHHADDFRTGHLLREAAAVAHSVSHYPGNPCRPGCTGWNAVAVEGGQR